MLFPKKPSGFREEKGVTGLMLLITETPSQQQTKIAQRFGISRMIPVPAGDNGERQDICFRRALMTTGRR